MMVMVDVCSGVTLGISSLAQPTVSIANAIIGAKNLFIALITLKFTKIIPIGILSRVSIIRLIRYGESSLHLYADDNQLGS
jgi:hypothetical protein